MRVMTSRQQKPVKGKVMALGYRMWKSYKWKVPKIPKNTAVEHPQSQTNRKKDKKDQHTYLDNLDLPRTINWELGFITEIDFSLKGTRMGELNAKS